MIRPAGDSHTPMMQQYFRAKEEHPGEILFFRMGDFYEMFYDDARRAAELLGITLTSRSKDRGGEKIPMAGVPVKSVDGYIRRLVRSGHRVAVCEQVQDPKDAKGIVDREVVRVVTPGTFLDDEALEDERPLHLAALVEDRTDVGVAWVDLSTGKFFAEETKPGAATEEILLRIAPSECLYPEGTRVEDCAPLRWLEEQYPDCARTSHPEWNFDRETARERLLAHFGTRTLEGFGCEHLGVGLRAAGGLIHYLQETQRQALPHIARLVTGAGGERLRLDAATHRALDLLQVARSGDRRGSLLGHLDRTRTAMGARALREWLCAPLVARREILDRQGAVAALVEDFETTERLREALGEVRDIERLASRLPLGRVHGRDLRALESSLRGVPGIKSLLSPFESHVLGQLDAALVGETLERLAERIDEAIVDEPPLTVREGGVIRDGYDTELDELRQVGRDGVNWIARFQEQEVARTGIPNLKVGYNRVFGYYLEVTHAHRDKIPGEYTRKQTLKNAERYITPSLKEQENRVLGARERGERLEYELFQSLRQELEQELGVLQEAGRALGELDALVALATVAASEGYVAPEVVEEPRLEVVGGLHPVLAAGAGRESFVPNDVRIGGDHGTLAVITGPNMAGKSTYIRQAAILTLLAQMGSFVPAESARIGITDRIFTRVGAADDLSRGQSTFMVEMTETANILNNATERSLIILDEVGRGTSTLDGVSLAWAIAEHLVERVSARTLFATHYHELIELEERFPSAVRNLNVAVREWQDEIVFLHKIVAGGTDKAYGIHVARLAGLPGGVLHRAREVLGRLEEEHRHGAEAISRVPSPSGQQLDLFDGGRAYEELDRRLRRLSPDETTPLEALQLLAELRRLLP